MIVYEAWQTLRVPKGHYPSRQEGPVFWRQLDAENFCGRGGGGFGLKAVRRYVVNIEGQWYFINVTPLTIQGNFETASPRRSRSRTTKAARKGHAKRAEVPTSPSTELGGQGVRIHGVDPLDGQCSGERAAGTGGESESPINQGAV